MSLKTGQSPCLTNTNVFLVLMTIQIIMAILIPKYYLDIKKKIHLDLAITNIEPDTIKNALYYRNIVAMTLASHYTFKK